MNGNESNSKPFRPSLCNPPELFRVSIETVQRIIQNVRSDQMLNLHSVGFCLSGEGRGPGNVDWCITNVWGKAWHAMRRLKYTLETHDDSTRALRGYSHQNRAKEIEAHLPLSIFSTNLCFGRPRQEQTPSSHWWVSSHTAKIRWCHKIYFAMDYPYAKE